MMVVMLESLPTRVLPMASTSSLVCGFRAVLVLGPIIPAPVMLVVLPKSMLLKVVLAH
jgi:hypothetical protein